MPPEAIHVSVPSKEVFFSCPILWKEMACSSGTGISAGMLHINESCHCSTFQIRKINAALSQSSPFICRNAELNMYRGLPGLQSWPCSQYYFILNVTSNNNEHSIFQHVQTSRALFKDVRFRFKSSVREGFASPFFFLGTSVVFSAVFLVLVELVWHSVLYL